ncbi:uncharacterized protein AB675_12057 [Cyphellophora attinorum]|uniref:Uncharacterized protein n=1 Tax=Cyphellophora attinorum TaxID=1664694 RepID=A0A0N0NKN4_9EURO|nr:uncharacterized protein AB675_12057 [Phialophora attinorum]KPI38351.1 hypothetical protein AB675_12057 [Phialophora attinorum]
MAKSILALERYPLLLRLHLHANFPSERFDSWSVARMNSAFRRETFPHWRLTSMLVASWMTATPALDRIMEQEEEAIVAAEVERHSWKEPAHQTEKELS